MKDEAKSKKTLISELNDLRQYVLTLEKQNPLAERRPDGIVTFNKAGRIISTNTTFLQLTGYQKEDFIGKHFSRIPTRPKPINISLKRTMADILAGKDHSPIEFKWRHQSGETRDGIAHLIRLKLEKTTLIQAILHDITDIRRAEEKIRQGELKYRIALQNITDGFFILNRQLEIVVFNRKAEKLLGRSANDVLGKHIFKEAFPEASGSIFEEKYTSALKDKKFVHFETYFGVEPYVNWYDVRVHPSPEGITVFFQVVTEQKRASEELEQKSQFIESLINLSPDIIYIYDIIDRVSIYSNDGLQKILGYTFPELSAMGDSTVSTLMHPDDFKRYSEVIYPRYVKAEDNEAIIHKYRMKDKNGDWHWLESNEVVYERLPDGRVKQIFGVCHDITSQKAAEDEIVRQKNRVEQYLDMAGTMFVALNNEGNVILANRTCCEILGYDKEEILGKNWFETFIPERIRAELRPVSKRILSGDLEPLEYYENPVITKSGTEKTILWHNALLKDDEGNISGHISAGLDLTERKRLEEEQRQSQKMEAVGQLAGGIAHDFNNMLSIIIGYTEILLAEDGRTSRDRENLEEIKKAAHRSASLTSQLLAFSRRQILEPVPLCLNGLISDNKLMLQRLLGENIELLFSPGEGLDKIMADPGQIEQVIINLSINARDAMPAGGGLTIKTRAVLFDAAMSELTGVAVGPGIELSVSDQGGGMEKEVQDRIFEPFFTTKKTGEGTGLGLSTVYGIVKQSRGSISVSSEPGRGTTFTIHFPAVTDLPEVNEKQTHSAGDIGGSETILIAEDEPALAGLIEKMLLNLGYRTILALSGPEALEKASACRERIDLLLTDVVMPGMSGKELAQKLADIHPETEVCFMSGYTDRAIVNQGIKEGETHFIHKPFRKENLAEKLRKILGGKRIGG